MEKEKSIGKHILIFYVLHQKPTTSGRLRFVRFANVDDNTYPVIYISKMTLSPVILQKVYPLVAHTKIKVFGVYLK